MTENKRFTEIISTQKVIDNLTGKEYNCLIDDDLLELLNELHEENKRLQEENKELEKFKHFIFKSLNHIYEDKE